MPIEQGEARGNEAQIAVHWKEEEYILPSAQFIGQANLVDAAVLDRFKEEHFPECFRYADLLAWNQDRHTTLDTSDPPFWKWFAGGKLNACYNCVDRHLAKYKNKAALIFVPEPEDEPAHTVTYQELFTRVNEVAAVLRDFCGLKTGDRVTIHMPMIPELPITMLACARLGVIHSVVFGGFSGEAAGLRAADSGSRVMIYADGYYRNGKIIDHKPSADIAVEAAQKEGQKVEKILVWRRCAGRNSFVEADGPRPRLLHGRGVEGLQTGEGRSGLDGRGSAALPDVHERDDRQAQGVPAQDGRLSGLRHRHLEVLPGHSAGGRLLVHG